MIVTDEDRVFYHRATKFVTDKLQIAQEFTRYNGIVNYSVEQLNDLLISGLKYWLTSHDGARWLASVGYRPGEEIPLEVSSMPCPACGDDIDRYDLVTCTKCGRELCYTCLHIVDPIYRVGWCGTCFSGSCLCNLE